MQALLCGQITCDCCPAVRCRRSPQGVVYYKATPKQRRLTCRDVCGDCGAALRVLYGATYAPYPLPAAPRDTKPLQVA